MKFADFVSNEAINAGLEADDKESVIREMIQSLIDAGKLGEEQVESIVSSVLKREELGSTGIGRGVAVPHTKHPSVERLVATVAVSTDGVDFNSLDGEKVQLFFLLISPPDRPAIICGRWRTFRVSCATTHFVNSSSSPAAPQTSSSCWKKRTTMALPARL